MNAQMLSLESLASLLDQHTAPTFVLGEDGRVLLWNRACASLTGIEAKAVVGTRDQWKGFYTSSRPCLADLVLADLIELVPDLFATFSDFAGRPRRDFGRDVVRHARRRSPRLPRRRGRSGL